MSTPSFSSRRDFLKQSVATTAALGFPAILSAASPNSMVQVASVGADGMAFSDISNIITHEKVK